MTPHYADESVTVYAGDCLDVLATLPDASVDSVCTDPPYGLEFMGREWDGADGFRRSLNGADAGRDSVFGRTSRASPEYRTDSAYQAWCRAWAAECLRVLKPGGHLLAFGGTRTYHRLACAVEDAGFEIRDSITWIYGSGFPKSLDVSKAIDAAAGAEREVVGTKVYGDGHIQRSAESIGYGGSDPAQDGRMLTAPATNEARRWAGWGTALKPAHEPIVVARRPLAGTVAANVVAHGTGGLNIDGCRVGDDLITAHGGGVDGAGRTYAMGAGIPAIAAGSNPHTGRWPSNIVLSHAPDCAAVCVDGCPVAELDRQGGVLTAGAWPGRRSPDKFRDAYGEFAGQEECVPARANDTVGASRFFPTFRYEAKAPTSERPRVDGMAHATVKPLELMRWLVRLVTPPGGCVLDPFAGSGTTAEACIVEGFRCLAIEREADYLPLIVARLGKPLQPVLDMEVA